MKSICKLGALIAMAIALTACSGPAGLTDKEFDELIATGIAAKFSGPDSLAWSSEDVEEIATEAKRIHSEFVPDEIDQSITYDVIIQVGHFPRTTGSTGSSGELITEQEGSVLVATQVGKHLSDLGLVYAIIGADDHKKYEKYDGRHTWRTNVFLSIHLDGSEVPCRVQPSIGYNPEFGKQAMHTIGLGLALALDLNAREFMRDNYTRNLSHFYGYKSSNSQIAEGILELSELSCPDDEQKFLANSSVISRNIATALSFVLEQQNP